MLIVSAGGLGDNPSFCGGLLRASGGGVITCSTNADCTSLDPECPGGNCGACSLVDKRRCFNDPISINALTNSGADHAVLGSTFCVSPTGAGAVDSATGSPGPASLLLDFNFNILCSDGTTEYAYGGQNCP